MLDNFVISVNAVLPMFCIMVLGYVIKETGRLSVQTLSEMNKIVYWILLPALIIDNIYSQNILEIKAGALIGFCVAGILLEYVVSFYLVKRMDPNPKRHAVLMQSFFRSNMITMGVPISLALYTDISVITIAFAVVIPIYNILASLAFEQERHKKINFWVVFKNPLVLATIAAVILSLLQVDLPEFADKTIDTMGTMGYGLNLFLLGASVNLSSVKQNRKIVFTSCCIRLIIMPVIFLSLAAILGFRAQEMCAILIVFASPVPPVMYAMAKEFDADAGLAGEMVACCNAMSCATLFLWIFVLKSLVLL